MTNPHVLLALAYQIIGAPSRQHAASIFAQMCLQDLAAAAHLAEFLAYVIPDTTSMWGTILQGIAEHQAAQQAPPPFLWTDADSVDTAVSVKFYVDAHLRGDDNDPKPQ